MNRGDRVPGDTPRRRLRPRPAARPQGHLGSSAGAPGQKPLQSTQPPARRSRRGRPEAGCVQPPAYRPMGTGSNKRRRRCRASRPSPGPPANRQSAWSVESSSRPLRPGWQRVPHLKMRTQRTNSVPAPGIDLPQVPPSATRRPPWLSPHRRRRRRGRRSTAHSSAQSRRRWKRATTPRRPCAPT
jgi:hypothetical protein